MSVYCLEATKYKFHWTNKKSLNRKHNPKRVGIAEYGDDGHRFRSNVNN